LAEEVLAKVVAIAPVTARATTRLRTMTFMFLTPFLVTQSGPTLKISLDRPDGTTLRCPNSQVHQKHLHNRISNRGGYQRNQPVFSAINLNGLCDFRVRMYPANPSDIDLLNWP
jgi:hypothetical protein